MKITEFSEVFKTFSNIYNRIPEIEQNVVVDNDYYIENDWFCCKVLNLLSNKVE